jgi:hypothetical protein
MSLTEERLLAALPNIRTNLVTMLRSANLPNMEEGRAIIALEASCHKEFS